MGTDRADARVEIEGQRGPEITDDERKGTGKKEPSVRLGSLEDLATDGRPAFAALVHAKTKSDICFATLCNNVRMY